jgi:uncharacterized protein YbjT (DUF2867 family)
MASLRILLFGASGMIGQGALRECLLDPGVAEVLAVVRRPLGQAHPRLREVVRDDPADLAGLEADLARCDACFFCLGVSSAGLDEAAYRRVTLDLTLGVARALSAANPAMRFLLVTGAGTDASERGRVMWARVKGAAENAVARLPFGAVWCLRPGYIQPLHGITSRTRLYRALYALLAPLYPLLDRLLPGQLTTTERLGRAMLVLARRPGPGGVLEARDLAALVP